MIIGIDGNEANVPTRVGIGEYAFQLLSQFYSLKKQKKTESEFVIYLKDEPLSHLPPEDEGWTYKIIKPRKFWTRIGLPLNLFLDKEKPAIFFSPSHYGPYISPVKTAISIMDLSYIHFPELFAKKDVYQLTNWTAHSAKQANHIFTISNMSKNDIMKEYQVASSDVTVTHLGIKEAYLVNTEKMADIRTKFSIQGDYILFVGTLQPRKNITRLIEAFSKVIKAEGHEDLQLVIVGKKGWLYEKILEAPNTYHVLEQVKFLDFVSDEDLPGLYEQAKCYVLPSLYEGFGLPVLEAMKYGCPVITSNISSLPEAGGDAALYVDPYSPDDIAEKIVYLLDNPKVQKEMREKGYEHIKKFSWEKTAKETLDVLERLAGGK